MFTRRSMCRQALLLLSQNDSSGQSASVWQETGRAAGALVLPAEDVGATADAVPGRVGAGGADPFSLGACSACDRRSKVGNLCLDAPDV
ncbi:MAG: hypothetical protein ABI560_07465, partial [Myxococcales bacterium]